MENLHEHSIEKPNKYIVIILLLLSFVGIIFSFKGQPSVKEVINGKVLSILAERETILNIGNKDKIVKEQTILVEITLGDGSKKEIKVLNDYKQVEKGDSIFISESLFEGSEFSVVNVDRTKELILLLVFFIILVILTSGWKGFYSLVGLLFTFAVIFVFMVPQILKGTGPVIVGIISATIILIPTLYLSYGLNKKSVAAFLGIIIALSFVGIASSYFISTLQFTGFSSELSTYLDMETSSVINLIGLIIAGIIIAAVGVLDDVAVIQSSVVFSLAKTNPTLRGFKLFKEAMHIGKDHISAVVNTLVLAYTGASLPLIILLYIRKMPIDYFVSLEMITEEVARTLISSSGILLAVPLTTLIATMMVNKKLLKERA
jgi:uncharacterized membrane protein